MQGKRYLTGVLKVGLKMKITQICSLLHSYCSVFNGGINNSYINGCRQTGSLVNYQVNYLVCVISDVMHTDLSLLTSSKRYNVMQ